MSRLSTLLHHSLKSCPDKECLADHGRRVTFRELDLLVAGTADRIRELGVEKGDRIALVIENSLNYMVVYLAGLRMGAIVVPIDVTLNKEKVNYITRDCSVKKVICSDFTCDIVGNSGVHLDQVIVPAQEPTADHGEHPIEEDIACILYTTGSTGYPKGAVLRHRNVYASLNNITEYIGYHSGFRELVALPLTHSFGLNQVLCNLLNGGFAYLLRGFGRMKLILELLEQEKITCFPGTPTSYRLIFEKYFNKYKKATPTLKDIMINSSPLPPEDAKFILEAFPQVRLMVYYGLTEASRSTFHTHSLELGEKYLSSVGRATPNVEVAVIDDRENHLGTGQEGEVVVRAETLLKEYWRSEEETSRALVGGWFKTGDLGYLDEQGYLFITGRLKDQINVGGQKTSSKEIMNAILSLEEVRESYVFGRPDRLSGEVPVACVVLNSEISKDDLLKRLSKRLEAYKMPRELHFLDEIPKSETGKVLKSRVTELLEKRKVYA